MSSILPFIFVLGVLVFVHELGHFLLARWHGVRVLTFSLGFGPKLFKFTRGDTEYCISIIPLGGFVKMAGETPEDDAPPKSDEFFAKTKWQRFQIYIAGPAMNVLAAFLIMIGVYLNGATEPSYQRTAVEVGRVIEGSSAAKAGIKIGDRLIRIAGNDTPTWGDYQKAMMLAAGREIEVVLVRQGAEQTLHFTPDLIKEIHAADLGVRPMQHLRLGTTTPGEPADKAGLKAGDVVLAVNGAAADAETTLEALKNNVGKPLTLRVRRDGAERDFTVTPIPRADGTGRVGVEVRFEQSTVKATGFLDAVRLSYHHNLESAGLVFKTLRGLFLGEASPKQLTGFIGIARASGAMAAEGAGSLFMFMAMLSMNLAILNLLPIPMLDGGHIFIMMLEGLARRDFSLRVKERLLMAGFVLVMTLMVTVIYNDLMRIEWIEKLVPWR
ncbi:MAG: RIP metalloprotease RseP [Vicinamibacteraceae bacterium]